MSLIASEGFYRPWKVGFCLASTARIAFDASSVAVTRAIARASFSSCASRVSIGLDSKRFSGFAVSERGPLGELPSERQRLVGERVRVNDAIDQAGSRGLLGRQRLIEHQKLRGAARAHPAGQEIGAAAVADDADA